MKFTLEITTDNAAFHEPDGLPHASYLREEVIRLLGNAAEQVRALRTSGGLIDYNGNTVGNFTFETPEVTVENLPDLLTELCQQVGRATPYTDELIGHVVDSLIVEA